MTELSREEVQQMTLSAQLRAHANCKLNASWESQARMLMEWAANTIDAANVALSALPIIPTNTEGEQG